MIELIIKHSIAFLYLLAGSISDIRTREVADWANYSLITLGIVSNLIFSLVSNDWNYILTSLMGFGAFLLLALLMFYTGQWGGGDSKMLMGLGALYGLGFKWTDNSFLTFFLINTLIAGAVYGLLWALISAIKNRKKFLYEYKKIASNKQNKLIRIALLILLVVGISVFVISNNPLTKLVSISSSVMLFSTFYLWTIIKAVENSCMYKFVEPDKLTEGDWIAKDVKHKGKVITGPKDLGIEKHQISLLKKLYKQNKIKKILVKEGIPFVPSFFIGWIFTFAFGNILYLFI